MYIIISQTFFLSLVATFISRGSFFVCMSGLTLATFTTFLLVYVVVYIEYLQLWKRGWFWIPCGLSDKWDEFCSNAGITKEKVWQLCEQYQYPLFLFFVFKGWKIAQHVSMFYIFSTKLIRFIKYSQSCNISKAISNFNVWWAPFIILQRFRQRNEKIISTL